MLGRDSPAYLRFPRLELADSALHAPAAGSGDTWVTWRDPGRRSLRSGHGLDSVEPQ
jgi:hypothetical protein